MGELVHALALQITGGRAFNPADQHGGGIKSTNATLTLTDCVVFGNQTSADGGGVYVDNAITWKITGTEVRDNTAGGNGGGVAAKNSALVVEKGSAVNNNTAGQGGGGIYVFVNAMVVPGGTSLKLDGTVNPVTVNGNRANDGDGGGVLVQGGAMLPPVVDVLTSTIADNKAYGTVVVQQPGNVKTLTRGGRGGGIAVIGAFTVNADAATTVSNNGQQAQAPVTPPAKLGVYFDPAVGGTFAATANVTNTNYLLPL